MSESYGGHRTACGVRSLLHLFLCPGNELMPLCTTSIFAYHIISTAQSLDLLFCQGNSFSPKSILSRLLNSYCLLLTPLLKINYPQISLFLYISPSPMGQCVSILGLCCLGSYSFQCIPFKITQQDVTSVSFIHHSFHSRPLAFQSLLFFCMHFRIFSIFMKLALQLCQELH